MTDDARNDTPSNPYADLPEGYGGVPQDRREEPRPAPSAPEPEPEPPPQTPPQPPHRGTNRPDWRKGPLQPEDLEPTPSPSALPPAPPPTHWIEREAEARRQRLRELEAEIEAEQAGKGVWPAAARRQPPAPAPQPSAPQASAPTSPPPPHAASAPKGEAKLWPPRPSAILKRPDRNSGSTPPPPPPPATDSGALWLDPTPDPKPSPWPWRLKWLKRLALVGLVLLILCIAWLSIAAPPSQTAQPIAPPRLTLLASDGSVIARNGAIIDKPVTVKELPPHVTQAFLAIEDRRFYAHFGMDPIGIARALWSNIGGGSRQGGSTITQQLAKITYLNYERNMGRKLRELLIAFWLEGWLTKDEILERYLSNVYFGDNVYGLRAASLHYFNRKPEKLTVPQAAMLAGMVKAPSRLAPTKNLKGAQTRSKVVMGAMVDAKYLTAAERARLRPATLDLSNKAFTQSGTYFADWATPQVRDMAEEGYTEQRVKTTLDARLQAAAARAVNGAGLGKAQVALVAMRPNGEVVAMIGGRSYKESTFNRVTQAKRQPGSTFKLFTYLAALRAGKAPDDTVSDAPITSGDYRPKNYGNSYGKDITLKQAFAKSSNVAAVRLYEEVGGKAVIEAARDLGIKSPIVDQPSTALGTSTVTLLELTAAYAGVAGNRWPLTPHAIAVEEPGLIASLFGRESSFRSATHKDMEELLKAVVDSGTGRAAGLAVPAFGKTGTSQDSRDALFVGYAGDLVVGVWVGNDDNSPIKGISGGGLPARIWKDFMMQAVKGARPFVAPKPKPLPDAPFGLPDSPLDIPVPDVDIPRIPGELPVEKPSMKINPNGSIDLETKVGGQAVGVTVDREGNFSLKPPEPQPPPKQR